MELLLLGAVGLVVLFWAAVVVGVVALVKGVSRSAHRRTAVTGARLRAAGFRLAGDPRGDVAAVRARLARAVHDVEAALADAERADLPVGDVPHLARRLRRTASEVDARARVLERLGDQGAVAARLPVVAAAATQVCAGADDLTAALLDAAGVRDAEADDLREACAREADALRDGVRAARLA